MELTHSATLDQGSSPVLPTQNGIDRDPNDAATAHSITRHVITPPHKNTALSSIEAERETEPSSTPDTGKSCDRRRPEEQERLRSRDSMTNMSSLLIGKTVTPFLREHIPSLYAPIGKPQNEETSKVVNPNTRYCYRHRPDSKCRRAADEAKMVMIQNELDKLTTADQQAITHVWSLFSAAPARHRELMLQGVLSQLCFPQLSLVSREVNEALKIDFITALPVELSQKILCFLDTVSLTKAAQVSQRWRQLADADAVWVKMCEQHVNRKCTKCGWGLPLLERKRLRNYTRQRQLAKTHSIGRMQELTDSISGEGGPHEIVHRVKRNGDSLDDTPNGKRRCTREQPGQMQEPKTRSWKAVYKDRWEVGYNWKFGRCSVRILKGHTNGVTCLQLDDNILATGSYDATIKIWNIETGEEIRTLRGHTRGIRALQFDDSKLISGSLDNTIKIWNWHTGECISTLQGHTDGVVSVHFDAQLLASGSIDKSVKIFDFNSKEAFCLKGHSDWVNCTRLDINSRTVISASDDTTVKLWDLDTRQVIRTFEGHVGHVQQVLLLPPEYEPDDELINGGVNGSGDNTDTVSVSSGRDGTPTVSFAERIERPTINSPSIDGDVRPLYGSAFEKDLDRPLPARYFLSGGLDSTIRLWDSATGRCLKTMFGHLEGIWALAGDTIRVISGANDGMVKCWEPRSGKCDATFTGHRGPVTCVGLNDSLMASGSEDGEVRLYSFKSIGNGADAGTPS
ncbi:hypothetical protein QBC42DRAFT_172248 [Cladorrhinum samala]|uniref:F-box domain-containing protein n=1 Tax=Cladorrhinum samala TaxID=585594 RepID=A0AAV9HT27_9PEZI|nr:hypothetical protein QBC42DRAFT_172248 [Cladorrhinum samala]